MNDTLRTLFYIFVVLAGCSTLTVTVFATIKSGVKNYWWLVAFHVFFSLFLLFLFLKYFFSLVTGLDQKTLLYFSGIGSVLSILYMNSIILYFINNYKRKIKLHSIIIELACVLSLSLFLFPDALSLQQENQLLLGTEALLSMFLFNLLLVYLLILGIFVLKKDSTRRKTVLHGSILIFAAVGLIESIGTFIYQVRLRQISLIISEEQFFISSIPYLIFSGVLIFYFVSYLQKRKTADEIRQYNGLDELKLSAREKELVPLLNQGLNNTEIAASLYISVATVKTHLNKIYQKTGVKSRYEFFHLVNRKNQPLD